MESWRACYTDKGDKPACVRYIRQEFMLLTHNTVKGGGKINSHTYQTI